jgi:hypothetical protein
MSNNRKAAVRFCRACLRIRNGALEYVSPHWRGDAAVGIKRTREPGASAQGRKA